MKRMFGVITPMVTPFTKNDNVDLEAADSIVDYLIENKIHGLYPCGTTGEMLKMSIEERKVFCQEVVKRANGRAPVYIQVGASNTSDTVTLAKHAVEIGADGIGIVTPQFFGVSDREMVNYYKTVAGAVPSDYPVYLYSIPQCAANDISMTALKQILEVAPNVVGMKYSGSDFIAFKNYILAGSNFDVIVGPDRLILPALALGCVGTVSGCSQCLPNPFVETYENFLKGNINVTRESAKKATELCEIVKSGANIAYFKAALEINGVCKSYMRAPALDLTDNEKSELKDNLMAFRAKYGYW